MYQYLALLVLTLHVLAASGNPRLNARQVPDGTYIQRDDLESLTIFEPSGVNTTISILNGLRKRDTGWISSTWTFATMTYYSAQWKVPASPITNAGNNIIFFFNSFENAQYNDILQPVLQFNNIVGGWSLASWYGDPSGNYYHSTPYSVNVGDTITGIITLVNGVWNIDGYVNGVKRTTISVSFNTVGTQANGQFALEVYNVDQCSKYPASNSITATNIVLQNNGVTVTPSWSNSVYANTCGAGAYALTNANAVQLTWVSGSYTPALDPGSVGIDISGGDIMQATASSALACAQICDYTVGCAGWTWAYPGSGCGTGNTNKCWLKSSIGTRTADVCRESGVSSGEVGIDRVGGDLAGMPLSLGPAATAWTCSMQCTARADCVAWTFNTPACGGNSCWLKGSSPARSGNSCRVTGVKGNAGIDRPGNDMAGSPLVLSNGATATTCANQCAATSGCAAWAFVNPRAGCETPNYCWLKNAAGTTTSSSCRISGTL